MSNMLGKRAQQRYGYAGRHCRCCNIDWAVREHKHSARQAEKRAWVKDALDLDQGESWLGDMLEIASFSGTPASSLSYWEATGLLEEIQDDYPTPSGFDGSWSTESAHVVLMRKRDRMGRVHDSLSLLERAERGCEYAQSLVKHPQFERVVI